MCRLGLVNTLVTHEGAWPNSLVWRLLWLYASSVKNKQNKFHLNCLEHSLCISLSSQCSGVEQFVKSSRPLKWSMQKVSSILLSVILQQLLRAPLYCLKVIWTSLALSFEFKTLPDCLDARIDLCNIFTLASLSYWNSASTRQTFWRYFTFVYFVRGKCLLENLDRNEMVKILGLLTQLHTLGT